MLNRCNKYGLFSNYLRWMAMFFVLIFHGGILSPWLIPHSKTVVVVVKIPPKKPLLTVVPQWAVKTLSWCVHNSNFTVVYGRTILNQLRTGGAPPCMIGDFYTGRRLNPYELSTIYHQHPIDISLSIYIYIYMYISLIGHIKLYYIVQNPFISHYLQFNSPLYSITGWWFGTFFCISIYMG